MKRKSSIVLMLLFMFDLLAQAQSQRYLKGEVVTKYSSVHIEYHAGANVKIKYHGIERKTNDDGEFRLPLPDILSPGTAIELSVEKNGYAIFRPYNGDLNLPDNLIVTIEILPLGNPLFKTPEEIEKWADEIRRNAKKQISDEDKPSKINLSQYIKDWAWNYGFTPTEAKNEIEAWIQEVENNKDPLKRAKAEFLKNNFAAADKLYGESIALRRQKREQLKNQLEKLVLEERKITKEIIESLRAQGDSRYQNYRFSDALSVYEQALDEIDYDQFPQLWADVQNDIALTNLQLGIRATDTKANTYIERSIHSCKNALKIYTRDRLPQFWARTQNNLGNALRNLGICTVGEDGTSCLLKAEKAYRLALEIYIRDLYPQDWAMTQNNLGNVLRDQGIRISVEAGIKLLSEAAKAYKSALEVYARDSYPEQWAATQNNVGTLLNDQGISTAGETGTKLLDEAINAHELALEVYTRDSYPEQWAATQNNLGNALSNQGLHGHGDTGTKLLTDAITAYRQALEIYTQEYLPQDWAMTQNNLGNALSNLGIRTPGEIGTKLLDDAVTAYKLALEIYTQKHLPQDWAMTQNNLGNALSNLGIRTTNKAGTIYLAEAVKAYNFALEVYTREQQPQDWAMIQNNLGNVLNNQGIRTNGNAKIILLTEAVKAYKLALEVRSLEFLPNDWAQTQKNLAEAYMALELWAEAAQCFINVLKVYPDYEEAYLSAVYLYHETLFDFNTAFNLNKQWIERHPNDILAHCEFAEKHFSTGRFIECERCIITLLENPNVIDPFKIGLRVVGIANSLALKKNKCIIKELENLQEAITQQPEDFKIDWNFSGTKFFISKNEKLIQYRGWLFQLFEALEQEDRESIVHAVQSVRKNIPTEK